MDGDIIETHFLSKIGVNIQQSRGMAHPDLEWEGGVNKGKPQKKGVFEKPHYKKK